MNSSHHQAPPDSVEAVILELARLSEPAIFALREALSDPRSVRASRPKLKQLGAQLGKDSDAADEMLALAEQLYQAANPVSSVGTHHRLLELLQTLDHLPKDSTALGELADRLRLITEPNSAIDRPIKLAYLTHGFLPNAVSFGSFVDLRPNFDKSRTQIENFVPIVQVRIVTETADGSEEALVFQMSSDAIAQLKSMLADVERKLDRLIAALPDQVP